MLADSIENSVRTVLSMAGGVRPTTAKPPPPPPKRHTLAPAFIEAAVAKPPPSAPAHLQAPQPLVPKPPRSRPRERKPAAPTIEEDGFEEVRSGSRSMEVYLGVSSRSMLPEGNFMRFLFLFYTLAGDSGS